MFFKINEAHRNLFLKKRKSWELFWCTVRVVVEYPFIYHEPIQTVLRQCGIDPED